MRFSELIHADPESVLSLAVPDAAQVVVQVEVRALLQRQGSGLAAHDLTIARGLCFGHGCDPEPHFRSNPMRTAGCNVGGAAETSCLALVSRLPRAWA